jgi:hypothetical protein
MTEYDDDVQRILDALDGRAEVSNVRVGPRDVTIDFAPDVDDDVSVLDRAAGGRFGSSVVVNTHTGEVKVATLRYGSLGLPDDTPEAGVYAAEARVQGAVEDTNPPDGVTARLRQMGGDIVHVIVGEPIDVTEFVLWYPELDETMDQETENIRGFVERNWT